MAITSTDPTAAYLPALATGSADSILGLFAGEPIIDDPRSGRVAGPAAVAVFVATQARWMREHEVELDPLRTTIGRDRSLTESLARLTVAGERTELPIAVVGDQTGGSLREIRVYHSNWPVEGRHRLRPPILPEDRDLVIPDIVGAYMEALAAGNLAGSEAGSNRPATSASRAAGSTYTAGPRVFGRLTAPSSRWAGSTCGIAPPLTTASSAESNS
jgi:hypothetical protein